jgi:hypothetical protein
LTIRQALNLLAEPELAIHPLCEIFPMLEGAEMDSLREDIRINGQFEPITLHRDGRILDDKIRYRACVELGITPITRTYEGDNPLGFVMSCNMHRQGFSESQRALIATRLSMIQEEKTAND